MHNTLPRSSSCHLAPGIESAALIESYGKGLSCGNRLELAIVLDLHGLGNGLVADPLAELYIDRCNRTTKCCQHSLSSFEIRTCPADPLLPQEYNSFLLSIATKKPLPAVTTLKLLS